MSKESDEMKAWGRVAGVAAVIIGGAVVVLLLKGCDEKPDYHPQPRPAAVTSEGCALPDAGADALDCTCPDKAGNCVIPACGVVCCF